jgi:hypothetical protein
LSLAASVPSFSVRQDFDREFAATAFRRIQLAKISNKPRMNSNAAATTLMLAIGLGVTAF